MRINHIIIGTVDLDASKEFYIQLLQFNWVDSFIDTGTGQKGEILSFQNGELDILLVPFLKSRLPSPQHVAFEVAANQFDIIFERAKKLGMKTRAKPPLDSTEEGIGTLETKYCRYRNFYVLDPMGVNIEIMAKI